MVVFPPAKINIGLYVTDKRTDGYHNIETLFYPIGLTDILEVVPDRGSSPGSLSITLSGLPVEGLPEQNLVAGAFRLLHERVGLPGVSVFLHKCIPTGAGLGGGSSDGASMLLLLNRLFDLGLSVGELFPLALQLGSDCPFFLEAKPCFARGRGEELVAAPVSLKGWYLYLFHPGTGISTREAYTHVSVGHPLVPVESLASAPVQDWKEFAFNAFEPYAFEVLPVIRFIRDQLYVAGAVYASMTGSGSAVYGIFEQKVAVPESIAGYMVHEEEVGGGGR